MKKLKIISAVLCAALISSLSTSALASSLYQMTEQVQVASGISLHNIKRLTAAGWQNINVISADISDDSYSVKALVNSENISALTTVKDLATANDTIAAINGDFFSWKKDETSLGSAVGTVVDEGEMLTSLTSPWNFATVAQNGDGAFIFDYIDCAIAVATEGGFITEIEHINKYDDLTKPVIYTRLWGEMSPGSSGTQKEVVIEDNKVVSVNHDMGSVEIPENGFIISYLSDITPALSEGFIPGETIELGINYEPKFEDIQFAVGAGTLLLKDGKKTELVHDITGNQPRTAIGVNEDFTKLYFVTVDGRQKNAKGVTLPVLADIMLEIGADDAANLDGGGSTTMVIKSPFTNQQTVANAPSEKSLRKVANGIGLVAENVDREDYFITVKTDSDYVFADTEIFLDAKLHDGTGNIIPTEADDFDWKLSSGKIADGVYTPSESGKQTLHVSKDGARAQKTLNVLDNPSKIYTGQKEYSIKTGESAYISLTGETADGFTAFINLRDTDITTDSSAIGFEGNNIKGIKKGTAVVTFDFKGVQTSAVIRVGGDQKEVQVPEDISVADSLTAPPAEGEDVFKFAVFGNTFVKNTLVEKLVSLKYTKLLDELDYELALFAGETVLTPDNMEADTIKAGDYTYTVIENNAFITMDNSSGSVTETDTDQWKNFINDVSRTRADNIFVVLPESLAAQGGMDNELLCHLAENKLSEAGKKLYVISSGKSGITNRNGVKHICVTGVDAIQSPETATADAVYYEFTVSGSKVTCQAKGIYN